MLYELLDTTGIYLGASSALNVVAAVEMAQKLGPGMPYLLLHDPLHLLIQAYREPCCHHSMRRRTQVSEPPLLQVLVEVQGLGLCDS
jgi:hypothetical protein